MEIWLQPGNTLYLTHLKNLIVSKMCLSTPKINCWAKLFGTSEGGCGGGGGMCVCVCVCERERERQSCIYWPHNTILVPSCGANS